MIIITEKHKLTVEGLLTMKTSTVNTLDNEPSAEAIEARLGLLIRRYLSTVSYTHLTLPTKRIV